MENCTYRPVYNRYELKILRKLDDSSIDVECDSMFTFHRYIDSYYLACKDTLQYYCIDDEYRDPMEALITMVDPEKHLLMCRNKKCQIPITFYQPYLRDQYYDMLVKHTNICCYKALRQSLLLELDKEQLEAMCAHSLATLHKGYYYQLVSYERK